MSRIQGSGRKLRFGQEIDIYCMVRDVLRNWWMILLVGLSAAMLMYVQVNRSYSPTYSIETVYVVTAKGVNTTVYDNLNTTKDTATRFAQIINSSILRKKVAEDLGMGGVPASISTEIVPETNLLKLKVTAKSPENAYKVLQSVMRTYPAISEYLIGNAVMEVLIAPIIPTEPDGKVEVVGPVKKAFLFGAVLVIGLTIMLSYLKDTIHKPSEVEQKLDTRLLGSVCHEEKYKTMSSRFNKKKTSILVCNNTVSFHYVEMMQKICWKVQTKMEQLHAKTLLVTSYLENEGKSTVAANIALSLSETGKKVVLVDLDFRKPSQSKIFDVAEQKYTELGDVLLGKCSRENLIYQLEGKNLYVILNKKEYGRSNEMLAMEKLADIMEELKDCFDYVIIDTPPMGFVADTEVIAGKADASLLVVREDTASAKDINDVLDVLQSSNAVSIGCVFNDVHGRISHTILQQYGYGYGKGYGKYYGNKQK